MMAVNESTDFPSPSQHPSQNSLGLLACSNEILIDIIHYILHADSLYSLALCSRRLRSITEPILYAHFKPHGSKSLPAFLCTLLARPDLASRVNVIAAGAWGTLHEEPDISGFTYDDWARVRKTVGAASVDEEQRTAWIKGIEKGNWHALAAICLWVTPNLKELEFESLGHIWGKGQLRFIKPILERAADMQDKGQRSLNSLANLKSVNLSYYMKEDGMRFDELEPFLRLKSVAKLEAFTVQEDNRQRSKRAEPRAYEFWTKELTLRNTVMSHDRMLYIFQAFKCLARLYYEHGSQLIAYSAFEPPRMMVALEHMKYSLEEISILLQTEPDMESDLEEYPIGSFAEFQKLVSIDIMSNFLVGKDAENDDDDNYINNSLTEGGFPSRQRLVDSLPPSLENLSLRNVQPHHVSHIFGLISESSVKTPKLTTLNLQWKGVTYPDKPSPKTPIYHKGFTSSQASSLMALCEEGGVEMIIEYQPPKTKFLFCRRNLTEEEQLTQSESLRHLPTETVPRFFPYPYDGFEECCREQGLDPETAGYWPDAYLAV